MKINGTYNIFYQPLPLAYEFFKSLTALLSLNCQTFWLFNAIMKKSILSSPQNNCGKKPHYMWVWFIEGGRKTTALFCNMLVVVPHTTTHWWHHFFLLGVEVPGCKGRLKTEPCMHLKRFFFQALACACCIGRSI